MRQDRRDAGGLTEVLNEVVPLLLSVFAASLALGTS